MYTVCLQILKFQLLEYRRIQMDLALCYKTLKRFSAIRLEKCSNWLLLENKVSIRNNRKLSAVLHDF